MNITFHALSDLVLTRNLLEQGMDLDSLLPEGNLIRMLVFSSSSLPRYCFHSSLATAGVVFSELAPFLFWPIDDFSGLDFSGSE